MYKRVLIKLSGEALGKDGTLFDFEMIARAAEAVARIARGGMQVALMLGGGNIWRGRKGPAANMDAVTADHMGMLATMINSLAMRDAIEQRGMETRVLSAVEMNRFAEGYVPRNAVRHLEKGRIVLFACGNGDPFHSTDTAAAQRAAEINADALLMAKNVDAIYDKNPSLHSDAQRFPSLTYAEALSLDQGAVDVEALIILKNNKLPELLVFDLKTPEDLVLVANGEKEPGTRIHP